jgi:hypothetical protein
MSSSALAPMWTPPYTRNAELTQSLLWGDKLTVWRGEVVRPGGGVGGAGEAGGEGAGGHGRDPVRGAGIATSLTSYLFHEQKYNFFASGRPDAAEKTVHLTHLFNGRCWENCTSYSLIQTSRNTTLYYFLHLLFTYVFMYFIQQCLIWCPSDSSMSEDAGIEPETVVIFVLE